MDRTLSLKKLKAYQKNPELYKAPSLAELADLVVVVLGAVTQIEQAIETKRVDIDTKFSKKTEQVLDSVVKDNQTYLQQVAREVNALINKSDSLLNETAGQLEQRVQEAIANIRNGDNGIVTEQEIARAAEIAVSLIDLPNFEELVGIEITRAGEQIRNALELLPEEERYRVVISDVEGLSEALNELARQRTQNGGTIGKGQVYGFIRQAIADGTISTGGAETLNDLTDVDAPSPAANQVLTWNDVDSKWEPADPPGASGGEANTASNLGAGSGVFGTKVGVDLRFKSLVGGTGITLSSDSNEITIDRDTIGTSDIADDAVTYAKLQDVSATDRLLGRDTAGAGVVEELTPSAVRTMLNVEDGAEVNNISDVNATDLIDGGDSTLHFHSADRNRANHTGTQTASTISDFDTEVSNNTDVAANTSARHAAVTVSGTPDYITLVGQDIVRGQIDLATDVTGDLPFANLTQLSAHSVLARAGAGTGDVAGITMGNDTILGRSGSGDVDDLSATQVRTLINVEDGADVTDAVNVSAAGAPIISSGAGAPASTPTKVGDIYIDTTNDNSYIAVGTASSADWKDTEDAGGGVSDGDKGDITVSSSGTVWTIDESAITSKTALSSPSTTDQVLVYDNTGNLKKSNISALVSGFSDGTIPLGKISEVTGPVIVGKLSGSGPLEELTPTNAISTLGITATATELNYVDGVTSAIQTQLDGKAPTASPTLTGTTTVDRLDYDRAVGGVSAIGNLGATETINWSTHTHYTGTLDSNITFTYSNQVSGETKTLYLSYDGTAQRTITWPTTTWLDNATGAAPTAPAASGNVLVVTLVYVGTTTYGSATGNYAVYA